MLARPFHFEQDYPVIADWWRKWKWEPVQPKYLPPTGIMIENNDKMICCCFIYRTDTVWCIIDWFLMNPEAKKEDRKGCLDFLLKEALKKAKSMGFEICDSMVRKESLMKVMEDNGYNRTEVLTKMLRIL